MTALHTDLLALLKSVGIYGLNAEDCLRRLRVAAHRDLTLPQTEQALRDLADKRFIAPFESPLSGKRWRITALGGSALNEEGL